MHRTPRRTIMLKMKTLCISAKQTAIVMVVMITVTAFTLVYINFSILKYHTDTLEIDRKWYIFQNSPCSYPNKVLDMMTNLTFDASLALSVLNVSAVACYGTLLGAMRRGDTLPWDNNVDLCVVGRIPKDFHEVKHVFMRLNIEIQPYDSWFGHYRLKRGNIYGFINVFSECSFFTHLKFSLISNQDEQSVVAEVEEGDKNPSWLCPDGTVTYSAHIINGLTKPIPAGFLMAPFPTIRFGSKSIQVPNGDSEILKYLYPDSWWLDVRPNGCH